MTFLVGVTAVATWSGSSGSEHAAAAAASPTTVAVPAKTTTSTTAPALATTPPASTTPATAAPRPATTTTTVLVGTVVGNVAHNGQPVAGAGITMIGPGGERSASTDAAGNYRFPDVAPGQYDMYSGAQSKAEPCVPGKPCVGSAVAMERRTVTVRAGETDTENWEYPYDSPPPSSGGASFTSPPATVRG